MTSLDTTGAATASGRHRRAALERIDGFNARDEREPAARTAGYVAHAPESMELPALDGPAWEAFLAVFLEGFPDLHLEVVGCAADEHMTAQRIQFTGTHTGTFRGLPPTGRAVRFQSIEINRMVDGKVAEHHFQLDALALFGQLGLRLVPGPRLLLHIVGAKVAGVLRRGR